MKRVWFVVPVLFAIAACGGGSGEDPSPSASGSASPVPTGIPVDPADRKPDAEQTTALLALLGTINPGLATAASVPLAQQTCADIQGRQHAVDAVVVATMSRFSLPGTGSRTEQDGEKISDFVRNAAWCS